MEKIKGQWRSNRKSKYKDSDLHYCFSHKIRNAFYGKNCPICNMRMGIFVDESGISTRNRIPTIQHNKPLIKGGEHKLGNISVICKSCNISIRHKETPSLNAKEVEEVWKMICEREKKNERYIKNC